MDETTLNPLVPLVGAELVGSLIRADLSISQTLAITPRLAS